MPASLPSPHRAPAQGHEDDILLIMPAQNAEQDEISEALKEAHGTIVGSIGEGRLKVLMVKSEKGKLDETEKKLGKDKHFATVQRNWAFGAHEAPVDDQLFAQEWHLGAIEAVEAWKVTKGRGAKIAVFDTGCQENIGDLSGKTDRGYRQPTAGEKAGAFFTGGPIGLAMAQTIGLPATTDTNGHGTKVATTAAATANNKTNTAGVAPDARIVPVQIASGPGRAPLNVDDLLQGLDWAMRPTNGVKIINISFGSAPPNGLTNKTKYSIIHFYLEQFYKQGGLVFVSAGNEGMFDANPVQPYMCVVSAVMPTAQGFELANTNGWASNFGYPVEFTAPGVGIPCSDRDGKPVFANGTSVASPIVAGIAALVWSANPSLSNQQVKAVLQRSCTPPVGQSGWTQFYGFGIPNAKRAIAIATGQGQ